MREMLQVGIIIIIIITILGGGGGGGGGRVSFFVKRYSI